MSDTDQRVTVVKAFPRLHLGLLDLGGATPRSYGGAGMAIATSPVVVEVTRSSETMVAGRVTEDLRRTLEPVLTRVEKRLKAPVGVRVTTALPEHAGLGSTTATVLAAIRGAAHALNAELSLQEIVALSGRGRTSGAGIQTFFDGGFVVDAGQRGHPDDGTYRPSVDPQSRPASTGIGSWQMPEEWRVVIYLNNGGSPFSLQAERDLFANCSGGRMETLEQVTLLYHGLLPSVVEHDLETFGVCLRSYQERGLKAREIASQHEETRKLLDEAWAHGLPAGLSSMGSCVFVIHHRDESLDEWNATYAPRHLVVGPSPFRNSGSELSWGSR